MLASRPTNAGRAPPLRLEETPEAITASPGQNKFARQREWNQAGIFDLSVTGLLHAKV